MKFQTEQRKVCFKEREIPYTFVSANMEDGVFDPTKLMFYPLIDFDKGVVIAGNIPLSATAALVHFYHFCAWIGIHDPEFGVVVVSSYTIYLKVGDLLPIAI